MSTIRNVSDAPAADSLASGSLPEPSTPTDEPKVESEERPVQTGAREDVLLDHEYDGIVEYDNPMPAWWKNTFWATFVFSLGYLFWFHLGGNGRSVQDVYEAEVAQAQALAAEQALGQEVSEEGLKQLMADKSSHSEIAPKYQSLCGPCHGDQGQGLIGPNLTDDHWIHGDGSLMDIYDVVSKGVPEKGMPPWERQLTPDELRRIVAFIGTMRGTNVPGKGPEGNPAGAIP